MGTITTGTGLISGIDIAGFIDSIITLESQGKFRLQSRISEIQTQQTAMLDINARLLNFKTAARSFRIDDIFRSASALSSNEDLLTATASTRAQSGRFRFIIKQLVSTSQQLSKGYATADASPLGLESLSFEFGNGRLSRDVSIEDLNGGQGIDRGRITINDSSGGSATIDLTDVTTLNEVIERINGNADVNVTAAVEGDHLIITDNGGGPLTISDGAGDTTATDLGIAGTDPGGVITGSDINYLGPTTTLASLNDGNGVLVRDNVADLRITARNGTQFEIDFGRIDQDIADATLLEDLNDGAGVRIDDDSDTNDIKFIARDGTEYEFDLTGVTTVGGLRTRISAETGGQITLEVVDGDHFKVVDNSGGGGLLRILGTEDNGTDVAEDLGILNEAGVAADEYEGEIIPSTIDQPAASTLQEIVDRINDHADNPGIVASIGATGLVIEDQTGGGSPLIIESTAANPSLASDLGIETTGHGSDTLNGGRLIASLNSVLVKSLNGGSGLDGATSITVSDRSGAGSIDITGLDTFETLSELVDYLNSEASDLGQQVTFALNNTGNGLTVTDISGGTANLTISGDGATALGIAGDVAADSINGTNLQLQYVANATKLTDLNYGRGIGTGTFRITDGLGVSAEVTIGSADETVYDVIQKINSRGLAIQARINDTGDGIIIEENLGGQTPFVKMKVETVNGSAAADLNLIGEAETVGGGFLDGSYERTVDLDTSDSLNEVVNKINALGIPVSASVVNTGGGATPYRLNLTSGISGRVGDLVVDTAGVNLGLTVLSEGRDAKVFFGSDNPENGFLITSSTNTLEDVLPGVTIDLHEASDEVVELTIERDVDSIVEAVGRMVTAFNDVVGRLDAYDFFDVDTLEKGPLLGDPTVGRVRAALYRIVNDTPLNVDGQFQFLTQVGIQVGKDGQLTFGEAAFREAYESDPQAVEDLIAAYDVDSGGEEEVVEGITVSRSEFTYNSLGIANLFDRLLEDLTDSIDGSLKLADDAFRSRIDLMEGRISDIDERLERRREQLTRQFTALETALGRLQSQSSALTSLASNLAIAGQQLSLGI
jgi:flagellar hook-associated protein 2